MKEVTQQQLKNIYNNLDTQFSKLRKRFDVEIYISTYMQRFLLSGYYSEERCRDIYNEAIEYLKKDITTKYEKDLKVIQQYVDDINNAFKSPLNYSHNSDGDLYNLAVGAAAGLGAAFLLSGPAGWLLAAGVAVAGIYNSHLKKEELIKQILSASEKMNGEAIHRLKEILDTLIIHDDAKALPFTFEEDDVNESTLTPHQKAIRDYLNERGITTLIHFTDEEAYESILKHGVVSRKEAKKRNISTKIYDNSDLNSKVCSIMKSSKDDYISLSITSINNRLLSKYKFDRGLKREKIIYIDASILWKEIDKDIIYCNMNAISSSVSFGKDVKALKALFTDSITQYKETGPEVFNRDGKANNLPTHDQAEILFEKRIDPKYILNKESEEPDWDLLF